MVGVTSPELSVILVTPDDERSLDKILHCLRTQTARGRIEVVIAAAGAGAVKLDPALAEAFAGLRVVAVGAMPSSAIGRAAAICAARAPVVALAEDHCFPEPDWAERLIAAHEGDDYVAVGPVVVNANPGTAASWADFVIGYGPWAHAEAPVEMEHLPGHNSSYRRAALMAYDNHLAAMLEAESVLHWDLRRRGHRLLLDPAIRVHHLNYSFLPRTMLLHLYAGRAFAACRAAGWSRGRRLLYAAASPLIPAVRLRRAFRQLAALPSGGPRLALRAAPAIALVLAASGLGELLGYALGEGGVRPKLARMEYHRWRNLRPKERHLAFE